MREQVTMADVARVAGVSTATVSYVLSGKRPVAPATRAAVEAAIADLGFAVNTAARSLRTGRSSLVALIVPDIANPFFAQLAATLQEELRGLGMHVVVCNTRADREEERALLAEAVQQRFAGVVITPFRLLPKDLDTLSTAGIPTVVSADVPFGPVDLVTPDARAATRQALEGVTAARRRRIAMIAGPRDATGGDPRLELLRSLAPQFGTSLPGALVVRGEHTREAGAAGFAELMSRRYPPDAVFCANDVIAVGALGKAHELGIDVPGDVALVGHDDASFASLVRPRLTTIRYPAEDVGRAAAELLRERFEGRRVPKTVRVRAEFVARASV
ncbi:LacI family DNA-binding transcriptional regulator [Streptomyces tropicalis]|uniref:LacI family DNA-binding transcriptional regulator n=1 Tax=Streptomyces tropicalis TaxID=3034234 RepID=A0ABT6A4T2_9ACTN|nr:LacI family DNA-binding transcriptional regulator [Streptomyces tropicalis]MDF3299637.1 LacI family DNA-binding transcriptional regulator [Streptomyces tropicalis]